MDAFIVGLGLGFLAGFVVLGVINFFIARSDVPLTWPDLLEEQKQARVELAAERPLVVTKLSNRQRTIEI